ncbi:MAG: flagellar export chaperone FliS [Steroidobacteraceae bacterium]|jgi:flagellar protein FliS|nr:flagellar export chaperone FliS [Steroidobacteraceae bacterium]
MHTPSHALSSYRQIRAAGQVAAAETPYRLVQLLLGGALERLAVAKGHLERREIGPKGEQVSRIAAIIDTLNASLDLEQGGDVARNLRDLYEWATARLIEANLRNDARGFDEVARVLREIKDGWDAIPEAARNRVPATP